MKDLADFIFFLWLLPVVLYIILPLCVFVIYHLKKLIFFRPANVESGEPATVNIKST